MKRLFVDTSGWMACADEDDPFYPSACRIRDRWLEKGGLLLTSDYVADETLTLLRVRMGLAVAQTWWRQVEGSSRLRWESVDAARAEQARSIFFGYQDKNFSFTDCTSFVIMRELRIPHVLSADVHFEQMGFTRP